MADLSLSPDVFGQMMLQSVRYAMGRMTSAPGDTSDAVKIAWESIPAKWQGLIMRDVKEELERCERMGETLGHRCDHDTWQELLAWITAPTP